MRPDHDLAAALRADARELVVVLVLVFVLLPLALVITVLERFHGWRARF
jgi:hypothetical protein